MSFYSNFIKKLQVFGVLFGARATKLAGIQDKNNLVTDTVTFTSPDQIELTFPVPEFLSEGTYFRIKDGGGPNEDRLLRVKSVNGSTIVLDSTGTVDTAGPVIATLDARIAIVQDDIMVSRLNADGNTIFNVAHQSLTPLVEGDITTVMADHYHYEGGPVPGETYEQDFVIGDWFVTDSGDTYSIDIPHGLSVLRPNTNVYEGQIVGEQEEVYLHRIKPLDLNNLRITVSKAGADARFSGTIKVGK